MKAYRCMTEVGPQYLHLQADAKKADPNYETVEIDVTKSVLLDMINDLLRRLYAAENGASPAAQEEEQDIPPAPAPPPAPKPKPSMPPHAVRNDMQIDWEEFIFSIPDGEAYRLDALQRTLDAQREIYAKRIAA